MVHTVLHLWILLHLQLEPGLGIVSGLDLLQRDILGTRSSHSSLNKSYGVTSSCDWRLQQRPRHSSESLKLHWLARRRGNNSQWNTVVTVTPPPSPTTNPNREEFGSEQC